MAPKIAIVTGAASGIGKHFAAVLATSGNAYRLALADVNEVGLRDAFVPSNRVRLHRLDVRSVQDWQVLIEDTLQAFGRIDYLFNIAGGGRLGFLLDQPIENLDFVIDVNLKGPVIGMKLVAAVMARQGGGHIINVGSLAGLSPTPGNALYSAAKSGLRAASLAAAVELRKQGVYVTLVAPDVVDTPLTQQHYEQPQAAALIYSGSRVLTVQDLEAAFFKAIRDKPLEINLPRWRGWLAKTNSLYPPLMLKLYEPLKKRGLKRLEEKNSCAASPKNQTARLENSMAEITVGELLMQCLHAEGVDMMAGIIDGAHIPFVVHAEHYGIRYVNGHHEEAVVHIAEGYTRIAHKPAVVFGNPGPGGANMLAGLTSAHGEGHPVIAIACSRRTAVNYPDRGGAWQATDLVAMAKPITKYSALVSRWDRVPEMVRAAFRAATTGRPGPALLVIPDEMLALKVDTGKLRITPSANNRVLSLGAGDAAQIEQAAELLANAKRPFIYAGKGTLWAGASQELVALGDFLAAGMGSSVGARGVIPEDHPHYFHLFDMQTTALVRNEADLVLVVGARLGEYDGWGMPPAWGDPARQKTIQIDADPLSIGVNRPVDLGIVADAKAALAALLSAVKAKTGPRETMPDLMRYREQSAAMLTRGMQFLQASSGHGVNPGQMVMVVNQFFPRDAVTVLDGGNTTLWGIAFNPILEPDSFLYSVKMGYLGTGLPFAIGAKLAAPERPVYCITGDGALGFCIMEMETALRANAPVIVVVAVDDAWGMERTAFNVAGFGPEQHNLVNFSPSVRYDVIAQGLGCYGEKVDELDQLAPALQRAVESGKPALIHVTVDPEVNANPIGFQEFRYARTL